jgi:hypothetical protein
MIAPDAAPAGHESGPDSDKQYVPLAALAIHGTKPEIGDEVEYTVRGTIRSLEGDQACIAPSTINDQTASAHPSPDDAAHSDDDDVMRVAMDADRDNESY